MANLYYSASVPYAPMPRLRKLKLLPKMEGSDVKVLLYLLEILAEGKKNGFPISNAELQEGTGLCKNTITATMDRLKEWKLARFEGGKCYMCAPSNGEPLPDYDPNRRYQNATQFFDSQETEYRETRNGELKPIGQRTYGKDVRKLRRDQYIKYYEYRLEQKLDPNKENQTVRCPFHHDEIPSMSLNIDAGLFCCLAASCGASGHTIDFEIRYQGEVERKHCDAWQAVKNIAEVADAPEILSRTSKGDVLKPVSRHEYQDEEGTLLFAMFRFPDIIQNGKRKKNISAWRFTSDNSWVKGIQGIRRVLYNLPQVKAANTVAICSGEKDADRLASLKLVDAEGRPIAATTAPFGEKVVNWTKEYSELMTGKRVLIFRDMDKAGELYGKHVLESVSRFAREVRLVEFSKAELGQVCVSGDHEDPHAEWRPGKDLSDYEQPPLGCRSLRQDWRWMVTATVER